MVNQCIRIMVGLYVWRIRIVWSSIDWSIHHFHAHMYSNTKPSLNLSHTMVTKSQSIFMFPVSICDLGSNLRAWFERVCWILIFNIFSFVTSAKVKWFFSFEYWKSYVCLIESDATQTKVTVVMLLNSLIRYVFFLVSFTLLSRRKRFFY